MPNDAMDHLLNLLSIPNIDLDREWVEARVAQFGRSPLEIFGIAAADRDPRAQLTESAGDS